MKNYTYKDELSDLRAGDTLELEDGTRHEAVDDKKRSPCLYCSLTDIDCSFVAPACINGDLHFKKFEP
jgi:hypothetical protein